MLLTQIPSYFKARRNQLMESHPGAVFVLPSCPFYYRNPDVPHPYRQESNFYYLTGFEEYESCLVLAPASEGGTGNHRMILFVLPNDPEKEMWEGARYGLEGARRVFGADEAYLIHELDKLLPELFKGAERVFYQLGFSPDMDRTVMTALETNRRSRGRSGCGQLPVEDSRLPIGELRLFKAEEEIQALRKACEISGLAHREVMSTVKPGMNESEIEALIDYLFRKKGCQRVGYGSIIAGGRNATCLHYRFNNEELKSGDLLLIDAGGEHRYYTADITRTFPIGKKFKTAQAELYELVLRAQKAGIEMARPGVTLPQIHRQVCTVLVEGLRDLHLLDGDVDDLIKTGAFRRFYPHGTSHWLGMDVHDVGLYTVKGEPRILEPGMVFTIEPGIYIQPSDAGQVPDEYRNIGIRIEDDILITEKGHEVLTSAAPKEVKELEALRG